MQKKIVYFTLHDMSDVSSGVSKKIKSQIKALGCYADVYLASINDDYFIIQDVNGKVIEKIKIVIHKYIEKYKIYNLLHDFIQKNNINVFYIRQFFSDFLFIRLLTKLKIENHKIFNVLEIPTYPYDYESKTLIKKIFNGIDKFYRTKYYLVLDKIVTYSSDQYIFDVPCINISNGIDEREILNNLLKIKKNASINFISVSSLQYWHGVDRFIEGLNNYYKNNPEIIVKIFIVGPDNEESKSLKNKVKEYNIVKYVEFSGYMSGDKLEEIYQNSNVGLGSLGRHRTGIADLSSLKNKEYCAKGLPFIYSENDRDFDQTQFIYKVSPDDKPIEIDSVIKWYNSHQFNSEEIAEYAKKYIWKNQMKVVLDDLY
ncbi:glycosyltransferase family 4 protein [Acinetobacter puyangensis]|uniref:Glycosyltransferase involved in cell wall bisynthesis n=1 Tax=Acinetobacter puyangensis TaxID=1096779 RepID=A0A240E940_9GAMM|nr:glycosyltransferase [Acinetobacter puyangensis]SNX44410.1 Glycosyltransferase involved in cell wall bisynthesis [Acinetobacter puyangensis]